MTRRTTKWRQTGQLCVQVQPERAPSLDLSRLKAECEALAQATQGILGICIDEGVDQEKYWNLTIHSNSPLAAWPVIRTTLFESTLFGEKLQSAAIVICTGKDGWNDYLLLHHFDPSEPLDHLPEPKAAATRRL